LTVFRDQPQSRSVSFDQELKPLLCHLFPISFNAGLSFLGEEITVGIGESVTVYFLRPRPQKVNCHECH
jgi:hypothetical protein